MIEDKKYDEALKLFMESDMKKTDVCRILNIEYSGFYYFLKTRHPELLKTRNAHKNSDFARSKRKESDKKYKLAIQMCETTDLSYKEIAEKTGVSLNGLKLYIRRYRRDLLLMRQGIVTSKCIADKTPLRLAEGGQSIAGEMKYGDAIKACDNIQYLELTVSEIARMFKVPETGLLAQLRDHFPEISKRREELREKLGYGGNRQRGARRVSMQQYAAAINELRETEKTLPEVAQEFNVSLTGLRAHLLAYHKDVVILRRERHNDIGRRFRREACRDVEVQRKQG